MQRTAQAVQEQRAVWQLSQLVVLRKKLQARVRAFALYRSRQLARDKLQQLLVLFGVTQGSGMVLEHQRTYGIGARYQRHTKPVQGLPS
ncbi:hypothetical protein D3C72_1563390 [compost metagenome]